MKKTRFLLSGVLILFLAWYSQIGLAQDLGVVNIAAIDSVSAGRGVRDYTYSVELENSTDIDYLNATITISTNRADVEILDEIAKVDIMPAGTNRTSLVDFIVVRHSRSLSLSASDFNFVVEAHALENQVSDPLKALERVEVQNDPYDNVLYRMELEGDTEYQLYGERDESGVPENITGFVCRKCKWDERNRDIGFDLPNPESIRMDVGRNTELDITLDPLSDTAQFRFRRGNRTFTGNTTYEKDDFLPSLGIDPVTTGFPEPPDPSWIATIRLNATSCGLPLNFDSVPRVRVTKRRRGIIYTKDATMTRVADGQYAADISFYGYATDENDDIFLYDPDLENYYNNPSNRCKAMKNFCKLPGFIGTPSAVFKSVGCDQISSFVGANSGPNSNLSFSAQAACTLLSAAQGDVCGVATGLAGLTPNAFDEGCEDIFRTADERWFSEQDRRYRYDVAIYAGGEKIGERRRLARSGILSNGGLQFNYDNTEPSLSELNAAILAVPGGNGTVPEGSPIAVNSEVLCGATGLVTVQQRNPGTGAQVILVESVEENLQVVQAIGETGPPGTATSLILRYTGQDSEGNQLDLVKRAFVESPFIPDLPDQCPNIPPGSCLVPVPNPFCICL